MRSDLRRTDDEAPLIFRFLEVLIIVFAQCVAAIGVLIGWGYIAPLLQYFSAAMQGQPWQADELAKRFVLVSGPMLLGGSAITGLGWWLWSSQVTRNRMRQYPDQPWMWQADWAEKMIRLSNRSAIWIVVLSTAFYGLVLIPLGIYMASIKLTWVVYSFLGAIGFFLLIFSRILWVNRLWNRSSLQLDTLPGVIGGHFTAVATIPESLPIGTVLRITLRCDMTRSSNTPADGREDLVDMVIGTQRSSNSQSSLRTTTIFEDHHLVTVDPTSHSLQATALPIAFQIPNDLPSSGKQRPIPSDDPFSRTRATDFCQWRVRIKFEQTNEQQEALFEVPIFRLIDSENAAQFKTL